MGYLHARRRTAYVAVGVITALLLAACGGGSAASSSSGSSSATSSSGGGSTSGGSGSGSGSGGSGSGALTLNWTAPTENTDGTSVSSGELAGYRIVYGESASALDEYVDVTDPTVTAYSFQNLPSGTWYFALESVDSQGNYSTQTNVVSATL